MDDFLWTVHESKWKSRYAQLREFHQRHRHCFVPISYDKALSLWVHKQRADYQRQSRNRVSSSLTRDRIHLLDQLNFCWSNANEAKWLRQYEELKKFRQHHGHSRVPTHYAANQALANWVGEQRALNNTRQRQQKVRKLNRLGFDWNPGETIWQQHFQALQDYKMEHGDCCVPSHYPPNQTLARWVQSQRQLYKQHTSILLNQQLRQEREHEQQGEELTEEGTLPLQHQSCSPRVARNSLLLQRFERLNKMDFAWQATGERRSHPQEENWMRQLRELHEYKEEHGDCLVPSQYKANPSLAFWVSRQRHQYQKWQVDPSSSTLTAQRIQQLQNAGFCWKVERGQSSPRQEETWGRYYEQLQLFKQQHGHCLVTKSHDKDLSKWAAQQRRLYKEGRMIDHRLSRLEQLDFEWDANEAQWQKQLQKLQEYQQEHGDCLVPRRQGSLGNWVHAQRAQYRKLQRGEASSLTKSRQQQLEAAGFVYVVRSFDPSNNT